jgi:hypothetical protein
VPQAHFSGSGNERGALHRHCDNIVAAIGAILGFSGGREPSSRRSAIVDITAAVVIATLALAVFLSVAAISPVVWTVANDTASQLRSELWRCLSAEGSISRLACYDEIARRPPPHPAKGANAPPGMFGRMKPAQ